MKKKVSTLLVPAFEFSYVNELGTERIWLEKPFREEQRKCVHLYQTWYSKAESLIKEYLYDWKDDFTREYDDLSSEDVPPTFLDSLRGAF